MPMKKTLSFLIPMIALAAGSARAQDVAINASPIRVEHFVKQGESGTDVINLSNNGAKSVRIRVLVEEWTLDAAGTPDFLKPARRPYSCASWIKVNPVDFRIDPKQTREIRYSLTCPQGIPDGGYRAAIVFETVADVKPGEPVKKVLIQGRLAVILYEKVGNPVVSGRIVSVKTVSRPEGMAGLIELANEGAAYFRTKGTVTVKDAAGVIAFETAFPDVPVLQNVRRVVEVPLASPLKKGTYSLLAVLDIGLKELVGGQTTFTLSKDIPRK
jgi:hypothetical protein